MEAISTLVILITLYCYVLYYFSGRRVAAQPTVPTTEAPFFVLLVPTLNEEHVIGRTLESVLALQGRFMVLVVDDASEDGTAEAIKPFLSDPRVRLLERAPAEARTGKGAVLNAGLAEVRRLGLVEQYGATNVVLVVFDADGRVDPGFLEAVAPYFDDPQTAGVQSAVRMYNAGRNVLTAWQHFEFVVWGELFSRAKDRLGSATLGGNGQCVRYAALADLGADPWRPSLTEDLDMSLRLLARGWRLRFCPTVAVWQEAVPSLRALVRQRSRWLQGHLVAWGELGSLLRAPLPARTKLDLVVFLLLPAALVPVGLGSLGSWVLFWLDFGRWGWGDLVGWYALGFGTAPLVSAVAARASAAGAVRAAARAHVFVFAYSLIWFLSALATTWNILLGRRAWAKTSRVAPASGAGAAV